ncbi:MAG: tRNA pseudouridine(38-40) synthase TruA, partial [Candidatus Omnitrophica bacterium]|nr:tRNA pseudouridine(38-40) synthase TruA [Candidatus Omnitrophota bacterium]
GYYGWQQQKRAPSVQGVLEKALGELTGDRIQVIGAGRTDRGVHALGQTAHFRARPRWDEKTLLRALNARLPRDVRILDLRLAPRSFHARYQAREKYYCYTVLNRPDPSPLLRRTSWHVPDRLNVRLMRLAARGLRGRRDFRSFQRRSSEREGRSPVRNLTRLDIERHGPLITFHLEGDGFLYTMARSLVGLLVEVGRGRLGVSGARSILEARDRRSCPKAAPGYGLCLMRVAY